MNAGMHANAGRSAQRPTSSGAPTKARSVAPSGLRDGSEHHRLSVGLHPVLGAACEVYGGPYAHLDTRPPPVCNTQRMAKRKRPTIHVTVTQENFDALERIRSTIPRMTRSALVDELLTLALPVMEDLAVLIEETRSESGEVDQARARDALAMWTGQQILKFTEPDDEGGPPG